MENPDHKFYLGVTDYCVIGLTLAVSTAIGVGIRFVGNRQGPLTPKDYLMAGGDSPMFPVILSFVVSMLSCIELLGCSEIYRYGGQIMMIALGSFLGIILATYLFAPVFFNSKSSTVHEFLEIRFGEHLRYVVSGLFIVQMMFFMAAVLYGPSLALSAVTDLSLEASIIVFGLACSIYCSVGGLKGVLWTDVFQFCLLLVCIVVLYVVGVGEAGGFPSVFKAAYDGNRLNFFDFRTDLTLRYTFWNSFLRGFIGSLAYCGCSQIEVQRILSLRSLGRAQASLLWSITPIVFLLVSSQGMGIVLYSIFKGCDPVLDSERTGITRYDQLVPYFIASRLHALPGVTGVCVAGLFSGSLSTLSSALNSLSTVTVVDFAQPLSRGRLRDGAVVVVARALSLAYGLVCIGLAFAISQADSIIAATSTLISIMEGPMLAVFLVAVLTTKADQKCAMFGLLLGCAMTSWIGYGIVFSGYSHPSLPLSSDDCILTNATVWDFSNSTCDGSCDDGSAAEPFILFKMSFMWIAPIGCVLTLVFIFLAVLVTGWNKNVIPADSPCISPMARFYIKRPLRSGDVKIEPGEATTEKKTILSDRNDVFRAIRKETSL